MLAAGVANNASSGEDEEAETVDAAPGDFFGVGFRGFALLEVLVGGSNNGARYLSGLKVSPRLIASSFNFCKFFRVLCSKSFGGIGGG